MEKWSNFRKINFYLEKVEKIEKKMILEHFPGSRMEKWSNFRKINFYLEKVEKKLKKVGFGTFSWIQDGKMIQF